MLDIGKALKRGGFVTKSLLVDLLAVPDPQQVGSDGAFFRFPFNTIESVHVVDQNTIISADDNNFPFSNGRSRSKTNARTGPLAADDNELILIQLGTPLDVDQRLLRPPPEPPPARSGWGRAHACPHPLDFERDPPASVTRLGGGPSDRGSADVMGSARPCCQTSSNGGEWRTASGRADSRELGGASVG